MKETVNKVQIGGNLGRDPEIREFGTNKRMARFSIATPEFTTNALGERVSQVQWHNAVAWGKTADLVAKNLSKGKQVVVNGKLSSRTYTAKDGTKKYATDVVVSDFEVVS